MRDRLQADKSVDSLWRLASLAPWASLVRAKHGGASVSPSRHKRKKKVKKSGAAAPAASSDESALSEGSPPKLPKRKRGDKRQAARSRRSAQPSPISQWPAQDPAVEEENPPPGRRTSARPRRTRSP